VSWLPGPRNPLTNKSNNVDDTNKIGKHSRLDPTRLSYMKPNKIENPEIVRDWRGATLVFVGLPGPRS